MKITTRYKSFAKHLRYLADIADRSASNCTKDIFHASLLADTMELAAYFALAAKEAQEIYKLLLRARRRRKSGQE